MHSWWEHISGLIGFLEIICWQHPTFPPCFFPGYLSISFSAFSQGNSEFVFSWKWAISTRLHSILLSIISSVSVISVSLLISSVLIPFIFLNELTTGLWILFIPPFLKQQALSLPLLDRQWAGSYSVSIKHCLEAPLCESWAFQVRYFIALISLAVAKSLAMRWESMSPAFPQSCPYHS